MMMIVNTIENALGFFKKNGGMIAAGTVVALVLGIVLGCIVAPFFI